MNICIFTADIDKTSGGPSRSVPILSKGIADNLCSVTLMAGESKHMNYHMIEGSEVKFIKFNQKLPENKKNLEY